VLVERRKQTTPDVTFRLTQQAKAHAGSKWGNEGFVESAAQEVADRRARRCTHRVPQWQREEPKPICEDTPARSFFRLFELTNCLVRRPGPNGRVHQRECRSRACAAAHGARLSDPRGFPGSVAPAVRRCPLAV